jgi:hypothetical protein
MGRLVCDGYRHVLRADSRAAFCVRRFLAYFKREEVSFRCSRCSGVVDAPMLRVTFLYDVAP